MARTEALIECVDAADRVAALLEGQIAKRVQERGPLIERPAEDLP